jgi:hypothetical protein
MNKDKYEPRFVSAREIAVDEEAMQSIKFQLEFMMLMRSSGRQEEADEACKKAYTLVCEELGALEQTFVRNI